MKIVGLTGGIGSGKTRVALFFENKGVPIYIADEKAKILTNSSKFIRKKMIALLGKDAYISDKINPDYIAKRIFSDKILLQKVNAIIHPKVTEDFLKWCSKQKGPYCIKESAILFENGNYKSCDHTILVTAPETIRINRVKKRDQLTEFEIRNRMKNQWSDYKKKLLADTIIENIELKQTEDAVNQMHLFLLKSL